MKLPSGRDAGPRGAPWRGVTEETAEKSSTSGVERKNTPFIHLLVLFQRFWIPYAEGDSGPRWWGVPLGNTSGIKTDGRRGAFTVPVIYPPSNS